MLDTVGIDISKGTLDAYWLSGQQHQKFTNDTVGMRRLGYWLQQTTASIVIFEATGVYGRLLESWLAGKGIAFSRVNPKQARRFAEGIGQIAKTDKVDAALLAKMGSLLELEAQVFWL